ncbi:MAG TPA: ABC transporter ATP-binding protein, partial [Bacillota bacterium]|nr:ABC transporter ATP-binding protein [Bacillota bacterium]
MIRIMRLLYPYFRPYQKHFWAAFLFLLLVNGLTYVAPYAIKVIWDEVFPLVKEPGGLIVLARWCGFLVLTALVRAALIFGFINLFWLTGAKVTNDLRNQLYQKLQCLPFRFYDTARTGDLMSRLTLDIEMVRNLYAFMFEHRSQIVLYLSVVTVLLFLTDWQLATACLILTPFVVVTVMRIGPQIRQAVDLRQKQAGVLNSTVQENIVGIRVVKAFGMEEAEISKFRNENEAMLYKNLAVSKLQTKLHPFLIFFASVGMVAILGYGGLRVIRGELTLGTLMQFIAYLSITHWPLWMLAPNINQVRQAQGSVERLLEILNQPEEITSPVDGGQVIADLKGGIVFDAVTFGYQSDLILKSLS